MPINMQGLRTVIYPVQDLAAAKSWWSELLGLEPYFDQPFYVGYEVGGYELGLLPDASPTVGALVYWGVDDVAGAIDEVIAQGGSLHTAATDVGEGIVTGAVRTPAGSILGLIHNPNFNLLNTLTTGSR